MTCGVVTRNNFLTTLCENPMMTERGRLQAFVIHPERTGHFPTALGSAECGVAFGVDRGVAGDVDEKFPAPLMKNRCAISGPNSKSLTLLDNLAGGLGFEPRQAESESAVLPLDDPPMPGSQSGLAAGRGHITAHAQGRNGPATGEPQCPVPTSSGRYSKCIVSQWYQRPPQMKPCCSKARTISIGMAFL
jgi:hypothetical protein